MSSPRTLSPTPPRMDTRRGEVGAETSGAAAVEPSFSTSSEKERALVAWSPTATATADVPMDVSMPPPPTIEELEAMDKEGMRQRAEICETPSASDISVNSKRPRAFSRQVSRVSGTGRATLQHASKGVVVAPRSTLAWEARRKAAPSQRDRLMNQAPAAALMIEQGARTLARSNLSRRSISADDLDRRLMSRVPRQDGLQRDPNDMDARRDANNAGRQPARQRARPAEGPASTQGLQKSNGNARNTRPRGGQRDARGTAARRAPYAAQGTPSTWKDNNNNKPKRPERKQPVKTPFGDADGLSGATASAGGIAPSKLRRRNSAPSLSDVAQEFETAERGESFQVESSRDSETCWGGGLPPTRNAIAHGPSGARAMAARAPPTTDRFPDRYPANDRESFARTLNDEELDEVWQGLGDGVSQRGCGSEVAFEQCAPSSPGTAVGAFPMLTANVLERHDQLAVSGGGVRAAERPPNVMPIPKDIGDNKAVHDMENGTPSSKKSSGSSDPVEASLLATVVSYGMLVLWMAHLVFNALLL